MSKMNGVELDRLNSLEDGHADLRVQVARMDERMEAGFERVDERLSTLEASTTRVLDALVPLKAELSQSAKRRAFWGKVVIALIGAAGSLGLKYLASHFLK